jgi:hypothetical protein
MRLADHRGHPWTHDGPMTVDGGPRGDVESTPDAGTES